MVCYKPKKVDHHCKMKPRESKPLLKKINLSPSKNFELQRRARILKDIDNILFYRQLFQIVPYYFHEISQLSHIIFAIPSYPRY